MKVPVATFLLFFFHVCIDRLPDNGQNGEGAFFFCPMPSKKACSFLFLCSLNRTSEEGTYVRQIKKKQALFWICAH
jgi:hypothetical protein